MAITEAEANKLSNDEHLGDHSGPTKEGLPRQAFAIVEDPQDTATWKLPHHTRAIWRALRGRLPLQQTVDWDRMPAAVAALSPGGFRGQQVDASPEAKARARAHLAAHYRAAGKPVPPTLQP